MSGDVVRGVDENKPSEVAHGIHQIGFATVVGDLAGGPEIDVENVEGAAEGPGKDKLAVASNSAVGSDAMGALEDPSSNVFATKRPEEAEADAMKSFVNAHVTSGRRSVVSREDVATEG